MAGTMGNFYVGVSGLQTNQNAMNTTAHNITNAGTEGYSRQQVLLADISYSSISRTSIGTNQVGTGTQVADIRLVRDHFVDKAYRNEIGREEFYQSKYDVVAEVENFFGELESSDFRTCMQNLWTSAQELQKESNSIVTRSAYIANAVSFIEQANEIYNQLTTYQNNLNAQIQGKVDRINELAETIYDLNYKITMIEASNVESANDYRDQRDSALDELAGLVSVSYKETGSGQMDVYIENRCLVSMDRTYKLDVRKASESCEYYVPIWEMDQTDLFSLHNVPSAETGTDVGSLKGIIMSRGDYVANYTDVPQAVTRPQRPSRSSFAEGEEGDAAYTQALDDYNTAYQEYKTAYDEFLVDKETYNRELEPYTVNNIIAQFDFLIHGIVTKTNDILCPNKEIEVVGEDGQLKTITVLDEEKAGYGMGETNQKQGSELFVRSTVSRYTEQNVTLADGTSMTVQVYNEEDSDIYLSMYTLGNLEVNNALLRSPSLLPLTNKKNEELQKVADELVKMWNQDFASVSPNSLVTNDFMGYYKEFISDFSNKGKTYYGIAESQNKAVQELETQRQAVVGVSTEEELTNLIRYQQGYNASSRYFNVVSEMLEYLIQKLG